MQNRKEIIEEYYQAMNKKDLEVMSSYLHNNTSFQCPFTKISGKKSFIEAAKDVLPLFESLSIRTCLNDKDKAIVIYDLHCPAPINKVSIAAFLKFEGTFISYMELFYDPRPLSFT